MNNTGNRTGGGGGGARRTAPSTTTNRTATNGSATNGRPTTGTTTSGTATSTSTGSRVVEAARRAAGPAGNIISAGVSAIVGEATNFDSSPAKSVVKKLAQTLGDTPYAIVGTCALGLLDIKLKRPVENVEVFVPTGKTSKTAKALCAPENNGFKSSNSSGNLRVWHENDSGSRVSVIFREPTRLHQAYPDANGFFMVGRNRSNGNRDKQDQDAADIDHLLKYIALQTKDELPNATAEFLLKFAASKPLVQAGFRYIGVPLPM